MARFLASTRLSSSLTPSWKRQRLPLLWDQVSKSSREANGTNVEVEDWGKRRLAYPIEDQTEGVYTLVRFESKPDFPAELDRIYKITDGIMRSIIVCLDD